MTPQIRQKVKAEIKEILIHRADIKKTITYGELCNKIGSYQLSPDDDDLHQLLGEISKASRKAGKGLRSVFVVNKFSKMPGDGFFRLARDLGYSVDDYESFFNNHINSVHRNYKDPGILTV